MTELRGRQILALLVATLAVCGCPATPEIVTYSDPLTPQEHAQLGSIYEKEGNTERALDEYAAAVKGDPENLVALTGLGNLSLAEGKPLIAIGYYKRALDVEPDNPVVTNNLAMAYLEAGRDKKALETAERAVELSGGDPRMLDTRARARLAAGDTDGAAKDLEKVITLCNEEGESGNRAAYCDEAAELLNEIDSNQGL